MLTERQEEILDFIRQFQQEHALPPSTRDIQRHFGFSSQTTVMGHLQALAAKGQLGKLADRKWGLKASEVQSQLFALPVYGAIPAGLPAMQEQAVEETILVDPGLFGIRRARLPHCWMLRVQGDSMVDAHIVEGDLVLLEPGEKEPKVTALNSGPRYATGKKGSYSAVESFLYTRPLASYGAIALSLLAFVAALYYIIRRRRAKK
jgi:repressor LexA